MSNNIYEKMKKDLIHLMKIRSMLAVTCVRGIISEINKQSIDRKVEINDDLTKSVLLKAVKQRNESIEAFTKGNRQDLIDIEQTEKLIIESFLPAFLNEEQTECEIKKIMVWGKDIGTIMKAVKEIPNINMSIASTIVKKLFNKQG